MKVGIYVRVSTADKGQDPELQLGPLRQYANVRGWDFLEYVDLGESGVKDRRPGLDRLMEDARKRRLDGILVWKLDRLGRSLKHLLTKFEEFHALGIRFISYTENLDFATPAGRAMASLIGVFAEFERDLIRERVRAGLENARRKGKRPGRRPFFDMASLGTLSRLRDRGMSVRAIAREMKVSKSLVHNSLKIMNFKTHEDQGSKERKSALPETVTDERVLKEKKRISLAGNSPAAQCSSRGNAGYKGGDRELGAGDPSLRTGHASPSGGLGSSREEKGE